MGPLGDQEISATKKIYGWPDEKFLVPSDVLEHFRGQLAERGTARRKIWEEMFVDYGTIPRRGRHDHEDVETRASRRLGQVHEEVSHRSQRSGNPAVLWRDP